MIMRAAVALALAALLAATAPRAEAADAPGAPGDIATWTEGDKDGIGSAARPAGGPLFTLDDGVLTEVYAPDLGTPSVRDLQFAVSDGSSFAEREREDATHAIELVDPRSLSYRQVSTARSGRWRITKTYVADPSRAAVLVDLDFESLTGRPYQLYALPTGRLWPLLAGERGEYELAAGELSGDAAGASSAARVRLRAIAATAGAGSMLPEQLWDENPPSGTPPYEPGTGTLSATPLAWTHAAFVRLAWSIDAGRPVERPQAVACRYALRCR